MQNLRHQPLPLTVKMFYHRLQKREEQKAWQMYLMRYQHMDQKTFKPFTFGIKKETKVSERSMDEILQEAEQIQIKLSKKGG